jgi:CRP-like cAMP-binding protein
MVGFDACSGGMPPTHRAEVVIGGRAWQLPVSIVREDLGRGGHLGKLLLRFMQSLHTQTCQVALCCRMHSVEQRLSSSLLALRDRVGTDEVNLTQEEVSHMLGVRRSGVTVAAGILRAEGLIDYRRGSMTVVDVAGLEMRACECYSAVGKPVRAAVKDLTVIPAPRYGKGSRARYDRVPLALAG